MTPTAESPIEFITERIAQLESSRARAIDEGLSEESYNVAWLEGAIYELSRIATALTSAQ